MTPRLSLILPVRDEQHLTLRCLQAIARAPEEPSFEVIVVDDASQDGTPQLLAALEGDVRVVRNEAPLGFGTAVDQGAALATGEHLVVVQQHAVPCDGWLTAIAHALDAGDAPAAVVPRSAGSDGQWAADAFWLALGVRRDAYAAVGGFAGSARLGRAEKASLLEALRERGETVAECRDAVFLSVPAWPVAA